MVRRLQCGVILVCYVLMQEAAGAPEEGTCDAKTGKCAAEYEYASDPPCFFPTSFYEVPVKAVKQETHNSKIISFSLPDGASLSLPVSSAIVMDAPYVGKGGKNVSKPYNPISSNTVIGSFDLLIKVYPTGLVGNFADSLKPGDLVRFKQGAPQIKKWQYPFGKSTITMLAGGTGIAPMFQALHPLLTTAGDKTKIHLIYGNLSPDDIMLKAELDQLATSKPDRLKVTYVVGATADDKSAAEKYGWTGEMGWIDEEKVKRLAFPPSADTVVWICGVDDMYKSLAGSRAAALKAGSVLHTLGYTEDMIWRS